jgi:hypothetical protein
LEKKDVFVSIVAAVVVVALPPPDTCKIIDAVVRDHFLSVKWTCDHPHRLVLQENQNSILVVRTLENADGPTKGTRTASFKVTDNEIEFDSVALLDDHR